MSIALQCAIYGKSWARPKRLKRVAPSLEANMFDMLHNSRTMPRMKENAPIPVISSTLES